MGNREATMTIQDRTEAVIKADLERMRTVNDCLEKAHDMYGKLRIDYYPYDMDSKIDLSRVSDINLLIALHEELHRYVFNMESLVIYAGEEEARRCWMNTKEWKSLSYNHYMISATLRLLKAENEGELQ